MVHRRRCRGVRRRADARLVGEEAALDAVHHAGAAKAAEDGAKIEGAAEDLGKDRGECSYVYYNDEKRNENVCNTHHGHEQGADANDALAAADQAVADKQSDGAADDPGRHARIVEGVGRKGGLQIVGCEHIEAHAVGEYQKHREYDGERS